MSSFTTALCLAILCCAATFTQGCKNNISAPELTLSDFHSNCVRDADSRTPDCVAAESRYCNKVTFPTPRTTFGVSREHDNLHVLMSCVQSHWKGYLPISELRSFFRHCFYERSQHRHCLAAVHRYCMNRFGQDFAGIVQEVRNQQFEVHCFRAARKENVSFSVMRDLLSYCKYPESHTPQCFASASRWCSQYFGYSGGITQEVGENKMLVACYVADYSGKVFNVRNSDFYRARARIDDLCSLDYDLSRGQILRSIPEILKSEMYDNTQSNASLQSTFSMSKEVIETSQFDSSFSFSVGAEAKIPFYGGGSITISASLASSFRTGVKKSKTKMYTHESVVLVPPGKKIVKQATVTVVDFRVPWTARVVNGLGMIDTVSGQWYGVSTHDLKVSQKDV